MSEGTNEGFLFCMDCLLGKF